MSEISPSRASVLRAVADGAVWEDYFDESSEQPTGCWQQDGGRRRWVDSKVRWLKDNGWAETNPDDADLHTRMVRPTDAGKLWLEQNPET